MALTKNEREALIKARKLIASGKEIFICIALDEVQKKFGLRVRRLKLYIARELFPQSTLGCWQESVGMDRSMNSRWRDRMAWIDWMLDEPAED